MKSRFFIIIFTLCHLPTLFFAQQNKSFIDEISRRLNKMEQTEHLSGVVLIAKDNKILYHQAFGFSNRADCIRNHPETRFNMASMTKMFTGMAILQLVEHNKLSLNQKVGQYLPNYPNKPVADSVTIHQLLTHTSGLGNFWEELDKLPKEKYKSVNDYIGLFVNKPLLFQPGSRYQYSNSGYILLGKIIEKVSGQSYFDYIKQHILQPAKMQDTDALELDKAQTFAAGYTMSQEHPGQWISNHFVNVYKGGPAGGYYTTASDLLRFSDAITGSQLLTKKSVDLYTTGKVKYDKGSYAYGISTDTISGHTIFGHTGGHFGIANEFFVCPDLGYTVVIMTNGEVENYWEVSNLIKSLLLGPTAASNNYYFTKSVIEATINNGEEAGLSIAAKSKTNKLRESVIDRWAYHLFFDHNPQKAMALLRLNAKSFPKSADAIYSLAEGYFLTGEKEKARPAYEQYLKLEPDDTKAMERLKILTAK